MAKPKLAISLGEEEYQRRFCALLLKHYKDQFQIYRYTGLAELLEAKEKPEIYLLSDLNEEELKRFSGGKGKIFYLTEEPEKIGHLSGEGVYYLEKYENAGIIIGEIIRQMGDEIREVCSSGGLREKNRLIGIYGLTESALQLPFAVTLGAILGEKERILILDLQENSGFLQMGKSDTESGLEELLVMAKNRRPNPGRIREAVGHYDQVDYIYPAENSETLCEADGETYLGLLKLLQENLDYRTILVNFGTRFAGFFELMNRCRQIYLMQNQSGIGRWREYEFVAEITRKGYEEIISHMTKIEIPLLTGTESDRDSCESLIEHWKWDAFGDEIRRLTLQEA